MKRILLLLLFFLLGMGSQGLVLWAQSPEQTDLLPPAVTLSTKEPKATDTSFVYEDHGKRDPFWRLVDSRGVVVHYDKDLLISDMVLEGIMAEDDGNNVAIISGVVVQADDVIGMFRVKEIQPHAVILEKGEEIYSLKLKKED